MIPKFRAWNGYRKIMADYVSAIQNGETLGTPSSVNVIVNGKNETWDIKNDHVELLQSTGLKDANGKEIYEMDILEYYYVTNGQTFYDPDTLGVVCGEPGIETTVIGKVAIWPSTGVVLTRIKAEYPEDFDSSNLDVPKMLHVNKRFTIIGNVHTNPELLEAQHD